MQERIELIADAPLQTDFMNLHAITSADSPAIGYLNLMPCPAKDSVGEQVGSGTGAVKSTFTDAAVQGIYSLFQYKSAFQSLNVPGGKKFVKISCELVQFCKDLLRKGDVSRNEESDCLKCDPLDQQTLELSKRYAIICIIMTRRCSCELRVLGTFARF